MNELNELNLLVSQKKQVAKDILEFQFVAGMDQNYPLSSLVHT